MIQRKSRHSKVYVQKQIAEGLWILVPQTADLEDGEIKRQYVEAIEAEDYEYAHALSAEANLRNLKLETV